MAVKNQVKLDADLERVLRKLGTVVLNNWCAAIVYFLDKINLGAIHGDYYHWACTKPTAIPGHQAALLEATFSDLRWTAREEEGNEKRCTCSVTTASFQHPEHI